MVRRGLGTKSCLILSILVSLLLGCSATKPNTAQIGLIGEVPDVTDYDYPPELIQSVKPEYNPVASDIGISGKVTLKLLVLKDGTVGKIQVLEASNPILMDSAVEAASKFIFKPATKNGRPKREPPS